MRTWTSRLTTSAMSRPPQEEARIHGSAWSWRFRTQGSASRRWRSHHRWRPPPLPRYPLVRGHVTDRQPSGADSQNVSALMRCTWSPTSTTAGQSVTHQFPHAVGDLVQGATNIHDHR